MRSRDLRQLACESAGLLRTMRAHLPASTLVHEIQCPRCRRWVRPRRYDVLCLACRSCKDTLSRPDRAPVRPASRRREIALVAWTRWDRCPNCDGNDIAEDHRRIDGAPCVAWRCRPCATQTVWVAQVGAGR